MVALTDLLVAETTQKYGELQRQLEAERETVPSDAGVLTAALRECVTATGAPVLAAADYAGLEDNVVVIRKLS
jgi:hypothetical protein